ncbi:hypothetical protein [Halobacteriovorax sp. HLS]|uniref:hypothetical protein n=1 Tax=Halobacteriovorax sp. HLS TaxID=2234000 RepID=UPI000FD9F154|nr:hypothetical protein [Halobacteriovorax sp. HLS]
MKKTLLGLMLLSAPLALADFTTVRITDFTGSYDKPDGRATASELIIPTQNKSKIEVTLQGDEKGYLLSFNNREYYFENPPAIINDIYTGNWKDLNYVTSGRRLSASIGTFNSVVEYSDTALRGLNVNCSKARMFENYGHQVLDACLTNSKVNLTYFKTSSSRKILNILEELPGVRASTTVVKNGTITISNKSFNMVAEVDIGMNAKVKIEGKTEFEDDKKRVSIRIDKAKASFLNIKNKIFDELKKSESDTFRVQKPYLYIMLK